MSAIDGFRLEEWNVLPEVCLIAGCDSYEIDHRGPVWLRDGSMQSVAAAPAVAHTAPAISLFGVFEDSLIPISTWGPWEDTTVLSVVVQWDSATAFCVNVQGSPRVVADGPFQVCDGQGVTPPAAPAVARTDGQPPDDEQCRYCPNDADRDEAGFLHCIECGWTDNPGKIVGLYESLDRLRAELAETRDRRDYLQGQLDIIYDAEYSRNDTLQRRIEKLTAAGDALAAAGRELYDSKTWSGKALTDARQAFIDAHAGWRSVRGDAPTQSPAVCAHPELDGPCSGCAPAVARTDGGQQ